MSAFAASLVLAFTAPARAETRSLKLYFVHTGEHATITYKRNGKFDPEGLAKLNRFLRDWRRNEPTRMDPRLFDLIWTVYKKSGVSGYINVLCGYRAPATNEMLRTRSSRTGVAKHSQHILGKAMDFYIPGVPLEKLREIGLKLQMGGVGYYPTSGSPFVHMDVGGVRAWPRPSRAVLARLFPHGKTLLIPPDGKPLPGYQQALADYKRRMSESNVEVASSSSGSSSHKSLLSILFGGGDEDEDANAIAADEAPTGSKAKSQPAQVQVASAPPRQTVIENLPGVQTGVAPPVPIARPAFSDAPASNGTVVETALVSSPARDSANAAISSVTPDDGDQPEQFADLRQYTIPVPQLLPERRLPGEAEVDVADVPLPDAKPVQMAAVKPATGGENIGINEIKKGIASNQDELTALLRRLAADGELDKPAVIKPKTAPTLVAALAPPELAHNRLTRSLSDGVERRFGKVSMLPSKGNRPSRSEAIAADASATPRSQMLTVEMIAEWAAAGNRKGVAPQSVDTAVYTRTDSAKIIDVNLPGRPVQINPARFSGATGIANLEKF